MSEKNVNIFQDGLRFFWLKFFSLLSPSTGSNEIFIKKKGTNLFCFFVPEVGGWMGEGIKGRVFFTPSLS